MSKIRKLHVICRLKIGHVKYYICKIIRLIIAPDSVEHAQTSAEVAAWRTTVTWGGGLTPAESGAEEESGIVRLGLNLFEETDEREGPTRLSVSASEPLPHWTEAVFVPNFAFGFVSLLVLTYFLVSSSLSLPAILRIWLWLYLALGSSWSSSPLCNAPLYQPPHICHKNSQVALLVWRR